MFEFCSMNCFVEYLKKPIDFDVEIFAENGRSHFKSKWEAALFWFLKNKGLDLQYEPWTLKFGKLLYVPDFWVNGHFIEVKGIWHPRAWKKVNTFKKFLDLTILDGWTLKLEGII